MKMHKSNKEKIMADVFQVEIRQHEDWHFATCAALPGLFVGNRFYDIVLKNIPESIVMLIKHDNNRDVTVTEAPPKSPTLLGNKTYVVIGNQVA